MKEKTLESRSFRKWFDNKFKWMRKHIVASAVAISFIFALIIHILFKIPAPNEWFLPEWDAGDLLTYSSTVALGLLAVWQNQKFKEANDKAQEELAVQNASAQDRLERINREANEISYIGKIIDFEKRYLETVEVSINTFINIAGFASMMDIAFSDEIANDALYDLRHQIARKYEVLLHLLKAAYIVQADKSAELKKSCDAMYKLANALITSKLESREISEESLNKMGEIDIDLSSNKLIYISARQTLLNMIMFEKWPLDVVRSFYSAPVFGSGENRPTQVGKK